MKRDVSDLGRQREDHVEVADRQQIGLTGSEPLACCGTLALGAVPIATAIVGDAAVAAVLTTLEMAAEGSGPAGLDSRHHLELGQAHVACVSRAPSWPMTAEDVGDLQCGSH